AVDRLCPCGAGDAKCRRADGNGKRLAAEKVVAARHALRLALHVTHSPHLVKHQVCFALVRPLTVASSPSARCATRGPLQTPAFRMNRFSQPLQFHRIRHAVEHTHRPANTTNEKTGTRHSCGLWFRYRRRSLERPETRHPPRVSARAVAAASMRHAVFSPPRGSIARCTFLPGGARTVIPFAGTALQVRNRRRMEAGESDHR